MEVIEVHSNHRTSAGTVSYCQALQLYPLTMTLAPAILLNLFRQVLRIISVL
jgi:hypothetical protein